MILSHGRATTPSAAAITFGDRLSPEPELGLDNSARMLRCGSVSPSAREHI
jgi:hypothetical protein